MQENNSKGGIRVTGGIQFGPTGTNKHYISMDKHRGGGDKRHKNSWNESVSNLEEYGVFETADTSNSHCGDGHYWGFGDRNGKVLGQKHERLAKFPKTSNHSDPWHGYPVTKDSKRKNNNLPSDDIVERWLKSDKIDERFYLKIVRGSV